MIDRTQEDINQDVRISNLEQQVRELKMRLDVMRTSLENHGARFDGVGRQLADHSVRLDVLEPLRVLVEHIEAIKTFFDDWKRGLRR